MQSAINPLARCLCILVLSSATLLHTDALATSKNNEINISVANTFYASGLMEAIVDDFHVLHPEITIKTQAVGSLQALDHVKNKQADIVITHYPQEEKRLFKQGYITSRTQLAHSKFAIFGPVDDVLQLSRLQSFIEVFKKMAEAEVSFVIPSPKGATYAKTEELWALSGLNPDWPGYEYTSISSTAALRQADTFESYVVADLGVFYNIKNELSGGIKPLYFDDLALQNTYSVMLVASSGPDIVEAKLFYDYLISVDGQNQLYKNARRLFNANIITPAAAYDTDLLYLRKSQQLLDEKQSLQHGVITLSLLLILLAVAISYYVTLQRSKMRSQQTRYKIELLNIEKTNAVNANKIKTEFVENISHDLRTPMQSILGFTDLCKIKLSISEYEKIDRYLDNINSSGNRLLSLINDLLEISKYEKNGGIELKYKKTTMTEMLKQAIIELDSLIKGKNISIDLTNANSTKMIDIDSERIAQVLNNLLSNAIKFSPDGSEIIININDTVLSQSSANDIAATIVQVSDQGVGIPEKETETIFGKFVQSSRNQNSVGTGLGLSICSEIIKAHGGVISATNNDADGSTFSFTIPDIFSLTR